MSTTPRRTARGQTLPESEVALLTSLRNDDLYARVAALYQAGWPLRAIGEAFSPVKARSSVSNMVEKAVHIANLPEVLAPTLATPPEYVPVRPVSPGISSADLAQIAALAPRARKFRAGMSSAHRVAVANQQLTDLCLSLFEKDVTIRELADAAGVTYRAMAKRLGRA